MPRLLHFTKEDPQYQEFVIILVDYDFAEVVAEAEEDGYSLQTDLSFEVEDELLLSGMPTDRRLE